jgi:RNA polymerase sigma factor (sigma-70 family)
MLNAESSAAITIQDPSTNKFVPQNEKNIEYSSQVKDLFSNEIILKGLKDRDKNVIKYIYRTHFQPIRHMILSNSGTAMDAEDIFQDALLVIYQKTSSGLKELTCSFSTFLYSVCRYKWLNRLEQKGKQAEPMDISEFESLEDIHNLDNLMVENEKFKLFLHHFEKLNEKERQVLKLFLKKVPLSEIASIMGYKSSAYAKVRKFLTKEKLRNSILNDPRYLEMINHGILTPVFSS